MSVAERIDQLCKFEGSQKIVAEKTGITPGALSAIITRGSQVRSDTIASILKAYPTLNARWLILGQGEMWEGSPLEGKGRADHSTKDSPADTDQELFHRLLILKLQEVARELKVSDPEAYRKLGLEKLINEGGGE